MKTVYMQFVKPQHNSVNVIIIASPNRRLVNWFVKTNRFTCIFFPRLKERNAKLLDSKMFTQKHRSCTQVCVPMDTKAAPSHHVLPCDAKPHQPLKIACILHRLMEGCE